jgi:hypothetical protein
MSSREESAREGDRRSSLPSSAVDAVGMVLDEGRPIADVGRAIGVNPGTLGNWVPPSGSSEASAPGSALGRAESPDEFRAIGRWSARAGAGSPRIAPSFAMVDLTMAVEFRPTARLPHDRSAT